MSVPSVDLVEIGAGGGSLARIDELGLLKVGPESSGADPGPACYGRGGTKAAVTDADLALGLLDAGYFLGGDMPLDLAANDAALRSVADGLGLPVSDTAAGVHELVNQNMAAAARMHAVEQGEDLRGVTVLAFGGAGPIHACGVAELLDSPRVDLPGQRQRAVARSARSCRRCASTSPARWCARSAPSRTASATACSTSCATRVAACSRPPACRATASASATASTPATSARATSSRIWVGDGEHWPVDDDDVVERFESDYRRIYGLTIPDVAVEAVTWRLSAYANADTVEPLAAVGDTHGEPRTVRARSIRAVGGSRRHAGLPPHRSRPRPASDRAGHRRGARDDRRHPARLGRRGRRRRLAGRREEHLMAFDPIELEVLWQSLIATVNEQATGAAAGGVLAHRPRGGRPRQRGVRPARPDGRPGRHRHARAHQLARPRGDRDPRASTRPTRWSRATC